MKLKLTTITLQLSLIAYTLAAWGLSNMQT